MIQVDSTISHRLVSSAVTIHIVKPGITTNPTTLHNLGALDLSKNLRGMGRNFNIIRH
jgi:hypothetical protein